MVALEGAESSLVPISPYDPFRLCWRPPETRGPIQAVETESSDSSFLGKKKCRVDLTKLVSTSSFLACAYFGTEGSRQFKVVLNKSFTKPAHFLTSTPPDTDFHKLSKKIYSVVLIEPS